MSLTKMTVSVMSLLFLTLFSLRSQAVAQKITPHEALLAKVALKYQSLNSLSHKVKGTMKIDVGGSTFTASFKTDTKMARQKQFRTEAEVEFFGSVSKGTAVTDGNRFWDYDPGPNEYAEQPIDVVKKESPRSSDWLMDRAGLDFPLMFFVDTNPMFKVKPGAEKAIKVKKLRTQLVDGNPMYRISLPVPSQKGAKPGSAVLYVGASDMLIRRCRLSLKEKGADGQIIGVEFVCFYSDIKPNATIDASSFTFLPPEDAKKVGKGSPAFDRAFDRPGE